MKLVLPTLGSRGDAEPFVAAGAALAAAGHQVRLVALAEFAPLAAGRGLDLHPVPVSLDELLERDEVKALVPHLRNPFRLSRLFDLLAPEFARVYEIVLAAAADADAMVCYPATTAALDVAECLGLPVVQLHHAPALATRAFPAAAGYLPVRTLTPWGNRASYALNAWLDWWLSRGLTDRLRADVLGLPARTGREALAERHRCRGVVVGASPRLVPAPPDWPAGTVRSGFLWCDGPPAPVDADTSRFLDAGPPPVFVTLGSTPVPDPAALTATLSRAAEAAGVRLVLQRGLAGLGDGVDPALVHVLTGAVSYETLFGRMAAVVHHGGAGTTGRGLRQGRPTLAVPGFADQFFWGHRVAAVGAGPPPLPLRRLSADRLAARLVALGDPRYAARAAALGAGIRTEDGPATAAAAIDRFLGARVPR